MITLLLAITMAQAAPQATTTNKPKPNYIIDGQALSLSDAIRYAVREPRAEVWECTRMELHYGPRSVSLKPVKAAQAQAGGAK